MRYEIRPLGPWTGPTTSPAKRRSSAVFRADWTSTLDLLQRETGYLGAQLVIVQVDADPTDIRLDGMLRSRARVGFDGVRVSFESRHGPLTYATDVYEQTYPHAMPGWQANVRAIALSLEALRAVDRYGVSRSGEQYRGWTAIANSHTPMSTDEAVRLLAEGAGWTPAQARDNHVAAWRAAARRHHPDVGGDHDLMARLTAARTVLDTGSNGRP